MDGGPESKEILAKLLELVGRAIDRRLSSLQSQTGILLNDMQTALYRIDNDHGDVYLGDIRVGAWHRSATELSALQFFKKGIDPSGPSTVRSMLGEILEERIDTMTHASTQLMHDVKSTLREIHGPGITHGWGDLRVGAWYRSSTECRIFFWLLACVVELEEGRVPQDLDALDETVDLDDDEASN